MTQDHDNVVEIDEAAVAEVWRDVSDLTGLKPFKDWLATAERNMRYALASEPLNQGGEKDILFPSRVVFSGPPGCGKTTAAMLAARLFHALGCIGAQVVGPVSMSELKLSFLVHSSDRVEEVLESAKNGTLVIEESPVFDDRDHVRMEVLDSFLHAIAREELRHTLIIFTELNEQVEVFLEAHPAYETLFSRVEFASFSLEECAAMFERVLARQGYIIKDEEFQHVKELAQLEQLTKGELFANAFWVQRLARCVVESARERSDREGGAANVIVPEDLGTRGGERGSVFAGD